MRIGILSLYDNANMGNKLQNYALEQVLADYGDNVLTIRNQYLRKNLLLYLMKHSTISDSRMFNRLTGNDRKLQFVKFDKQYIHATKKNYHYNVTYRDLMPEDRCDFYCAGSDQVWNPEFGCTRPFSYLDFADRDRTFAYAASFGVDEIPQQHKDAVRRGLQHIKYISVREDAGKRIVEELTGRTDVQVLVDPTMLLTTQQWDEIARKPKTLLPEKYILAYFLGAVPTARADAIREKAAQMGAEIIELMDPQSPFYAMGPSEFVYLIQYADLVCTDSFHASVFSFFYQRPLAIFERQSSGGNMGSRLQTLADKFGLQSSLANGDVMPDVPAQADYTAGYAALEEERKKSKAFLDMVFQEAERAGLCK